VITLVARYLAEGEAGLVPRSRRPRRSPGRTADAVEDEIVATRKDLDKHGHEAGAATIAFHLQARHGTTPAVSTIWRILRARGFVTPQPHKRPKSSYVRFAAEQPNERWQTDITHWTLAGGTDVEILHWLDDHSRLLLASTAQRVFTGPDIDASYRQIAARHRDPASVLSDNGAIYTGRYRGRGRVALEVTLHDRGVMLTHSNHRRRRQAHPAPQQPAAPHRHRPQTRQKGRHDPGPRPTHPDHHDQRTLLRDFELDPTRDYQPQPKT